MKKGFTAVLFLVMALLATMGGASAGVNRNYQAHISGEDVLSNGTFSAGEGEALFMLSKDGQSIQYKLIVANIQNVTQAHIHIRPVGVRNGPIAVWLYPSAPPLQLIPGRSDGILMQGTITALNFVGPLANKSMQDLLDYIAAGRAYVNVHTTLAPVGEIRGDIQ